MTLFFSFLEIISNIDLKKYLCKPLKFKGRLGYDTLDLLKVVLFGFTLDGYVSLRKLESYCKNDIRFMFLMRCQKPSHMTFSNFINNYLAGNIENIFLEINNYIFEKDKVDLNHVYSGEMYCPNGKKFEYQYNRPVKGNKYVRTHEVYKCESCEGCPYKEKCTNAVGDRYIKLNRELNA